MALTKHATLSSLVIGLAGIDVVLAVFAPLHDDVHSLVPGLLLLIPIVIAAAIGGWKVAVPVALAAAVGYALSVLPPLGTMRPGLTRDGAALVMFVVVGVTAAFATRPWRRRRTPEMAGDGAGEARDTLLRTVSHDLRNPLQTIQGATQDLLADDRDDDRRTALLGLVADETRRLERIVANMLNVSRLDAGMLVPAPTPEDPASLVARTTRRVGTATGHAVVVDVDPGLPDVLADPVQFDQVLTNLLENAIAHSAEDRDVTVAAVVTGSFVQVSVRDHGPGFDDELVAAGPRPFRSGRSSQGGLGLGLVAARGIVEAHGGTLELGNHPTGGAIAAFTVPVA